MKRFGDAFFAYRWYIGLVVWVACVLLELHGSSIGMYSALLQTPDTAILGHNRVVRSDEFLVNTPMAFSQYYNGFKYFSDIVRGTATDMFMVYGQPVWDFAVLFRPFHWGYLFLSPAKGLAFFWMGRLILLFLVSLEFGLFFCRQKRGLALVYALSLALSPLVQWWFAVNFVAEILIFGQGWILLLKQYFDSDDYRHRAVYGFCLAMLAGCYIFALYPAWQVSAGYVFAAVLCWFLSERWGKMGLSWRDAVIATAAVCLVAWLSWSIFSHSLDTIQTVRQTAYPGSRFFLTAGFMNLMDVFRYTFNYANDLWLPIKEFPANMGIPYVYGFLHDGIWSSAQSVLPLNNCEGARFFDLAPLGMGAAIVYGCRCRRMDPLLRNLLLVQAVFFSWSVFSFPIWFAKLSLLNHVTAGRIVLGMGLVNLMLLLRTMAVWDFSLRRVYALGLAATGAGIAFAASYLLAPPVYGYKTLLIILAVVLPLWYAVLRGRKQIFVGLMVVVLCGVGLTVNPLARGVDSIYASGVVHKIQEISEQDQGLWLVSGLGIWNNVAIMAGAPTINSTNTYPVLDRWRILDPDGSQQEVYNRYAHIIAEVYDGPTQLKLESPDAFSVRLNINDLAKLKVRYVLAHSSLTSLSGENVHLTELYHENAFYIYRVDY